MNIYERIQAIAQAQNITISELESELSLGNGTIGKWNQSIPKVDKLYLVAKFFEVPLESFLSELPNASIYSNIYIQKYSKLSADDQAEINANIDYKYKRAFTDATATSSTYQNGKKATTSKRNIG